MAAPLEPDDPRTLGGFRLGGRLGEGGRASSTWATRPTALRSR
ncbi:hypothetical protein [Microbispora bryophytorum]